MSGFSGAFAASRVLLRAERHGAVRALMIALKRRFYEALGSTVVAECEDREGEHLLPDVACGWRDVAGVPAP